MSTSQQFRDLYFRFRWPEKGGQGLEAGAPLGIVTPAAQQGQHRSSPQVSASVRKEQVLGLKTCL